MATHSRVLAWRIPGTGEPGGLPSMGLHRVRHDWRDLAAAAAAAEMTFWVNVFFSSLYPFPPIHIYFQEWCSESYQTAVLLREARSTAFSWRTALGREKAWMCFFLILIHFYMEKQGWKSNVEFHQQSRITMSTVDWKIYYRDYTLHNCGSWGIYEECCFCIYLKSLWSSRISRKNEILDVTKERKKLDRGRAG